MGANIILPLLQAVDAAPLNPTKPPSLYQIRPSLNYQQPPLRLKIRKSQLIRKRERQSRMLQHMAEAQILDLVLERVDLLVAVLEVALDDEGGRVAGFGGGGVVGASVAAFCERVGDGAVLGLLVSVVGLGVWYGREGRVGTQ